MIIIKKASSFNFTSNITVKVQHIKEGHNEAVLTGKISNKETLLKKILREYKRLGTIKIEDQTNED